MDTPQSSDDNASAEPAPAKRGRRLRLRARDARTFGQSEKTKPGDAVDSAEPDLAVAPPAQTAPRADDNGGAAEAAEPDLAVAPPAQTAPRGDGGADEGEAPPEPRWELPSSALKSEASDPLLGCLVAVTKHFGRPSTPQSLIGGLPLEGNRLTPALFLRAADRADLSARIVKRRLNALPEYVLPVILLLKGRTACVLFKRVGRDKAEVVFPETGDGSEVIDLDVLNGRYDGHAVFLRPRYHYSQVQREVLLGRGKSWFWGTLARFWKTYFGVMVAASFINLLALASPLFVMNVYDRVVPNQAKETLMVLVIGIGIIFVFDFMLRWLRSHFVDNAGKRADVLMSSKIFNHVLGITMTSRPSSSGAFANQLRDFEWLREFFTSATVVAVIDLPFLVLFILVIWMIAGPAAYIPAAAVPLVIVIGLMLQVPLRRAVRQATAEGSQKHGVMIETIAALDTVKSIGAEGHMQREWEKYVGTSANTSMRVRNLSGLGVNVTQLIQHFVTVAVVAYGVYLISDNELTIGGLIACTILTGRCMAPLGQIANILSRLHQSIAALKALNEIMAKPVERPEDSRYLSRDTIEGSIDFENVTFGYPEAEVPALRDISFKIRPGEKVGIIGPVGSGKSTISRLLMKLYEPDSGQVLVDGTDVRQMDPSDIRKSLGVLLQDVILFHGSVRDNIAMSTPHADDGMILRAAQLAGVHEFISQQPRGYDLVVGERGQTLSGGQRQCIALARSLLPDPPVVVLDEPTSMMDMPAENAFKQRMRDYLVGKTLILITHRPSLLDLVDRIIVVSRGRVVADGPRDEVLKKGRVDANRQARVRVQASTPAANR